MIFRVYYCSYDYSSSEVIGRSISTDIVAVADGSSVAVSVIVAYRVGFWYCDMGFEGTVTTNVVVPAFPLVGLKLELPVKMG
jgi:hypothetical protein